MTGQVEPEAVTTGQYVEVFGLQSQTGRLLNKQRGIVIKTIADTGRIEVCLGAEGKLASLKPECLRLVPGASAEEIQASQAPPVHDDIPAMPSPSPPERERSRSWSPPPDAVRAASLAGQQASGAAVARGMSSEQAEALGAEAAEQLLANLKKQAGSQQSTAQATQVSDSGGAAAPEKKSSSSFEDLKIGDSVKVKGLKGADMELNGQSFKIENFRGFGGPSNRKYVLSTTELIIDANGDPAERKRVLTLSARNIRLPGDTSVDAEVIDASDGSKSSKPSKKKSTSKRSRSRRRRSRSRRRRSDSSSDRRKKATRHDRKPAAALTKMDRLKRFNFL